MQVPKFFEDPRRLTFSVWVTPQGEVVEPWFPGTMYSLTFSRQARQDIPWRDLWPYALERVREYRGPSGSEILIDSQGFPR